jgi:hypothetical protein
LILKADYSVWKPRKINRPASWMPSAGSVCRRTARIRKADWILHSSIWPGNAFNLQVISGDFAQVKSQLPAKANLANAKPAGLAKVNLMQLMELPVSMNSKYPLIWELHWTSSVNRGTDCIWHGTRY